MKRPGGALLLALLLPAGVGAAALGAGLHAHLSASPAGADSPATMAHDITVAASATTPPARSDAAFVWDAADHVDLLFGGRGAAGQLDDTWAWDGSQWRRLHPRTSPPAMLDMAAAYDAGRGRVVLVGRGQGTTTHVPDPDLHTWSWDGSTWHDDQATVPVEEMMGAPGLAYDARHRQLVLAGLGRPTGAAPPLGTGSVPTIPQSAPLHTYVWAAGSWQWTADTAVTFGAPSAMAWDPATQRVLDLVSGTTACHPMCAEGRQLTWDGSAWRTGIAGADMGTVTGGTLVADPLSPGLVHTNGATVWSWDGSAWTEHRGASHPPAIAPAVAADPERHTVVVFGGRQVLSGPGAPATSISSKTYTWDGKGWSDHGGTLTPVTPPPMAQAPAAIAPTCDGGPMALSAKPVVATVQGDAVRLDVAIPAPIVQSNAAGSCAAGYAVTMQLTQSGAAPLPGTQVFDKTMATTESLLWTNWCGSGPVYLEVGLRPGGGGQTLVRTTPPCTDRSQPTQLKLLPAAGR